jgi:hypothetical protein
MKIPPKLDGQTKLWKISVTVNSIREFKEIKSSNLSSFVDKVTSSFIHFHLLIYVICSLLIYPHYFDQMVEVF